MNLLISSYESLHMPLSSVLKCNFYASSTYSDDVRFAANNLISHYRRTPMPFPQQVVLFVFLREPEPDDADIIQRNGLVEVGKDEFHWFQEPASSDAILDEVRKLAPMNAKYVKIFDWKDAILTILSFTVER